MDLKATVDRNVNSHCWQGFGSFKKLRCQVRQLTGSIVSSKFLISLIATGRSTFKVVGILVALKATVDSNVNSHCWQDFGSSEKLRCQLRKCTGSIVSSRFLIALISTGMSTLKVFGILVALQTTVNKNSNSHCWQDSSSSERYGYRVRKVVEPPERENPKFGGPTSSQCGGLTCEGE